MMVAEASELIVASLDFVRNLLTLSWKRFMSRSPIEVLELVVSRVELVDA